MASEVPMLRSSWARGSAGNVHAAPFREEGSGASDIASNEIEFKSDWGGSARSLGLSDRQEKEAPESLASQSQQEHVFDIKRTPPRPGKEHFRRNFSLFYPFTKADASPDREEAAPSAPPFESLSNDVTEEHVAGTEGGDSHSVVFSPERNPVFNTKNDLSPGRELPERTFFPPLPPLSGQKSRDMNRAALYSPSFRSRMAATSRDGDHMLQGKQGAGGGAGASCDFSQKGTGLSKELFVDMEEGVVLQGKAKCDGGAEILYELRDTPPIGMLILFGLQHLLSLFASIIIVPLILAPQMGGSDMQTAQVITTSMMVTGVTTVLHILVGSRLPLLQGTTLVFLAPAIAIINAPHNLARPAGERFEGTMREVMGAVLFAAVVQVVAGYSGLVGLLVELLNPVVVASTLAAVGLSFASTAFPMAGSCMEIGAPLIALFVFFALVSIQLQHISHVLPYLFHTFHPLPCPSNHVLPPGLSREAIYPPDTLLSPTLFPFLFILQHLRHVSIRGVRVFQILAVPLTLILAWVCAVGLTQGGVYDHPACSLSSLPAMTATSPGNDTSASLASACARHLSSVQSCRTDTSQVLRQVAVLRPSYPFQWGWPTWRWESSCIMALAAFIAIVDSIGTYHATSLLVASRPPPPGVVSRGIGMEGIASLIAGAMGTGGGVSSMIENIHTVAVSGNGSRHTVAFGAVLLFVLSGFGHVGALFASIPRGIVGGVFCVILASTTALGLSSLRYTEMGSSRNLLIVGLALFLGLSVPHYMVTYTATMGHRPINTPSEGFNFFVNSALSLHMIIAFLVSFLLDISVPGTMAERGLYIWSGRRAAQNDDQTMRDYELPLGIGKPFSWAAWVGI